MGSTVSHPVLARLAATAIFFASFEAFIFHTRLYPSILEPDSTTGRFETRIRNELKRPKNDPNQILVIGDSRMALLPRVANEMVSETAYTYGNISLGGITPRCWYYALRAADPTARGYKAVLMSSNDYNEPDTPEDVSDRETDVHYLAARLTLGDLGGFPWTYHSYSLKWLAARDMLLKGMLYKRDFTAFLANPKARLASVRQSNDHSAEWLYAFPGNDVSLAGLEIDWQHRTARFPDRFTPEQRQAITEAHLHAPFEQTGLYTKYLSYCYGRVLNYYRGSGTKLIFLRVPRAPVSPPDQPPKPDSAVRRLAAEPNVVLLDEHLFDTLERPEFFQDAWHLNRAGLEKFSKMLALEIRKTLGPPQS